MGWDGTHVIKHIYLLRNYRDDGCDEHDVRAHGSASGLSCDRIALWNDIHGARETRFAYIRIIRNTSKEKLIFNIVLLYVLFSRMEAPTEHVAPE